MDRAGLSGLRGSFLGDIDDEALEILLRDARVEEIARGQDVFPGQSREKIGVILEGTARTYLVDDGGRQLTLRYAQPLSVIAGASAADGTRAVPIEIEAVSGVCVLELNLQSVQALQTINTSVANAVSTEMSRRLTDVYGAFSAAFFGSLTERLAAHLVWAGERTADGMAVETTQHELAAVLGSAREVVARALSRLELDGVVASNRGRIVVLRPNDLVAAAGQWLITARLSAVDGSIGVDSLDIVPQAVIAIDASGEIVYANRATEETFGWQARELLGQPLQTLMPPPSTASFRDMFANYMQTVAPRPIGLANPYRGRRADGSDFPAEVTIMPVRRRDSTLIFATVVDVSYRSRLRELVAQRAGGSRAHQAPISSPARRAP